MREHFRTFDSKITFFAFADIITAVSGMLVFITLLLATDLGHPVTGLAQKATTETEQELQQALDAQTAVDAQINRLQELLTAAETSPGAGQLQSDIANLRAQLADEKKKEAGLDARMANSQAAIAARDKVLGLTDLKATVDATVKAAKFIAGQAADARTQANDLESQITRASSQLATLRERAGQLWFIPDNRLTAKQPIFVTISGSGISIDQFNRPDLHKEADSDHASPVFADYLHSAKSTNQYVVFLVKPSGISTFDGLVQAARDMGFSVGYDALEENREAHYSTPPPIDETASPSPSSAGPSATPTSAGSAVTAASSASSTSNSIAGSPASSSSSKPGGSSHPPPPPPEPKSWWERFLEWLGVK